MDGISVLRQISDDADGTLRRFSGNAGLLARFMKKFPQDPTFLKLESALQQKDYTNAVLLAHTLKGLAANFGFTELYCCCQSMVDRLRAEEYNFAPECFAAVKTAYHTVIAALESLD